MRLPTLTLGLVALCAPMANAQSLTGNVGSADVSKGESGVEARVGLDDEGNRAGRIHADYGFTDHYLLRVIGSYAKPDGEDGRFDALTFENWFQWAEERDDGLGFNGGFRVAYTFALDGGADEAEVRLTLTDAFADVWEWRGNLIAEFETGEGRESGANLEARAQLTRALAAPVFGADDVRLGAELFSEFGNTRNLSGVSDQAHQIGPVVKVGWESGVYLQSAVRLGLTRGSGDTMAKLFVGREF